MTWTLELRPPRSSGSLPSVLFVHDCGYAVRRSYAEAVRCRTYVCGRCYVREGYDLPSLASYPT